MKNWVDIRRGREVKTECSLCGDVCENVTHVLYPHNNIIMIIVVLGLVL